MEARGELPAEVEISSLPGRKLREVDRVVGGDEAWHASLDVPSFVESSSQGLEAVESRDRARRAAAAQAAAAAGQC
jgi:hypothetical protein